jgi:DNA-binding NarL/FixJ family response regulator
LIWRQKDQARKVIAHAFSIKESTVRRHLADARKKLKIHSKLEIIRLFHKGSSESMPKFTLRGKEVFLLIFAGLTDKRIAERLEVSYSCIRKHRETMLRQNNCESMLKLIARYQAWLVAEQTKEREGVFE